MTAERRRGDRFTINREFRKVDAGTLTYVSNISETGVFLNTTETLPLGTKVDLKFTVLLDEPVIIEGPGKVVFHSDNPMGMGVEFEVLDATMALRVADIVSQQSSRRHVKRPTYDGPRIRTRDLTPQELAELEEDDGAAPEPTTPVPPPPPAAPPAPPADEPEYIDL